MGGMSIRSAAWIAWSLWALSIMLFVFTWLFNLAMPPLPWREETPLLNILYAVLVLTYPTVGALVASRLPKNPIGWIFLSTGLVAIAFQGFAFAYAEYSLYVREGSLPVTEYVAWLLQWIAFPFVVLATVLLLLLFPSGSLPSRKWRVVVWMAVCGAVMFTLWEASTPGPLETHPSIDNPVEIGGAVGNAIELVSKVGIVLVLISGLFAVLSLIYRLAQARGDERQQMKWFVFATAIMFSGLFLLPLFSSWPLLNRISWGVGMFGFLFFPVATGIAILRYRLYNIDILINRTLVYGSLTLMLALVYFGGVTATQALFTALTGQEEQPQLAIVVSTLLIAALFTPLRRHVQSFIDRRFYRRKYDARKTLEVFSTKLRDETDLEALNNDLVGVVRETMQPEHVSLWLRPDPAQRRVSAD
jgi:hypothetical protein